MKKLLLTLFVLSVTIPCFAQEEEAENTFPYGKMLKMTHEELLDAKFKYNENKNQFVLTKLNGLNQAASILGALNGTPQNYVPHVDDYVVVIQGGEDQYSSIAVTFYDSNIYDKVFEFATTQGQELTETGTGNLKFTYADYQFEINRHLVSQSTATANRGVAAAKDQSYTTYNFIIFTGTPPSSAWHTKQALKEQKRDARGDKKKNAMDLM